MPLFTIVHFALSPGGLLGGGLAVLAFPAYRLVLGRWRARRFLEIQMRLEEGWQNTGLALALWSLTRPPAKLRKPGLNTFHSSRAMAVASLWDVRERSTK